MKRSGRPPREASRLHARHARWAARGGIGRLHYRLLAALKHHAKVNAQALTVGGGAPRSEILLGVLVATVRGSVGTQALLLTDSRAKNVDGLGSDDAPSLSYFMGRGWGPSGRHDDSSCDIACSERPAASRACSGS